MARIEGEIVIDRPIEQLFDFVADQRNEPRYNRDMVRSEIVSEGSIGLGTQFQAEIETGGRTMAMLIEVTAYERPRLLGSRTKMSGMDTEGVLTFESVGKEATRMRWSWNVEPRGLFRIAAPLVGYLGRQQERAIWTSLKRYLEAQT